MINLTFAHFTDGEITYEELNKCKMCKKRIEKAALSLKGVKMATWDIPSNMIDIIYDDKKLELKEIHNKIASVGHDTDKVKSSEDVYDELPMCCQYRTGSIH